MSQYFLSAGGGGAGGDVVGPASSTDNALVRFDGITGKIIQNGVSVETDAGEILAGNGSQSNPAYSFVNDPSSGIYSGGVDDNYFVSGGQQVGSFNSVAFSLNAHAHMTNSFSYALIGTAASTTMPSNTSYVGVTDTTAPRTITLDPNLFPYYGVAIFVKDETGTAAANNITIDTFGGATQLTVLQQKQLIRITVAILSCLALMDNFTQLLKLIQPLQLGQVNHCRIWVLHGMAMSQLHLLLLLQMELLFLPEIKAGYRCLATWQIYILEK